MLSIFKKKNKKSILPPIDNKIIEDLAEQLLISMANTILLGRMASVSNGGGSFENVTLVECTGITKREDWDTGKKYKEVRFKTDDSWVTGVYYKDSFIMEAYNEYIKTGELPKLM